MINTSIETRKRGNDMNKNTVWRNITDQLKKTMTNITYMTWISPLSIHYINEEDKVILLEWSEKEHLVKHVNDNFKSSIEMAAAKVLGETYTVIIKPESEYSDIEIEEAECAEVNFDPAHIPEFPFNLNNYFPGRENRYAYEIAKSIVTEPGGISNLLYYYGGEGSGKTHLLNALFIESIKKNPARKFLFVNGTIFAAEKIQAIVNHADEMSFREKYYDADILAIDDIQMIQNNRIAQGELAVILEKRLADGKQTVISGNCAPTELPLDERIKSMLTVERVVKLQYAELETKIKILQKCAEQSGLKLDDDINGVIELIAKSSNSNIRELKGALNKVIGFTQLLEESINVENAKEILKDYLNIFTIDTSKNV